MEIYKSLGHHVPKAKGRAHFFMSLNSTYNKVVMYDSSGMKKDFLNLNDKNSCNILFNFNIIQ